MTTFLIGGGWSPQHEIREWLAEGQRRYAGFSAGASVAAERALVGGWLLGGVAVCPDAAGEDVDEVTVVDGLGLVPFTVEVHCAQWGRCLGSLRRRWRTTARPGQSTGPGTRGCCARPTTTWRSGCCAPARASTWADTPVERPPVLSVGSRTVPS